MKMYKTEDTETETGIEIVKKRLKELEFFYKEAFLNNSWAFIEDVYNFIFKISEEQAEELEETTDYREGLSFGEDFSDFVL